MLRSLVIKNYALIESLVMAPGKELNIITGETGAGKSIMLGALGLIIGNRADTKVLLDEDEKCVVEATFDISAYHLQELFAAHGLDYDHETIIRRELSPSGRSRGFVNDSPATLEVLKVLGENLIDIHSQHDTLLLRDDRAQTAILDAFAKNRKLLDEYRLTYLRHRKVERQLAELLEKNTEAGKAIDYKEFLLKELQEASLVEGETETLEEELAIIENSEEIRERLNLALEGLSNGEMNVCAWLKDVAAQIRPIKGIGKNFAQMYERLESTLIELTDLSAEMADEEQQVDIDQERGQLVKDRLDLIHTLEVKHRVTGIHALLKIQHELELEVTETMDLDSQIATGKTALIAIAAELEVLAKDLSNSRTTVAGPFAERLEGLLAELGMPSAKMQIQMESGKLTETGADKVTFLFSANKGIKPQDLKSIASGGEFSRLMLAIKYLMAQNTSLPTLILDEIDTGISGEVAYKMGQLLQQMAERHQLVAITHLPQIAAAGQHHFFVYKDDRKDRSVSRLRQLSIEERITEIAQMMSGQPPTAAAMENAKELLTNKK